MFRNYFNVALRSFVKLRLYSFLNLIGLATGLASSLLIFLWVKDEVGMDNFHTNPDRLFRVMSNLKQDDGSVITWSNSAGPMGDELKQIPEITLFARAMNNGQRLLQNGDRSFLEPGFYADPDFFRLFNFSLLAGSVPVDSKDKGWIAISERVAKNLFGTDDPIGKPLVASGRDYRVTCVFKDVPANSTIKFEFILPYEVYRGDRGAWFKWSSYDHPTYVALADGADPATVEQKLYSIAEKFLDSDGRDKLSFFLHPVGMWYLENQFVDGKPSGGRIVYVKLFSVIAFFILLIACINFMNMATARAVARAKEVGLRKVVGAERHSLVLQFLNEAFLLSFISYMLAVALTYIALPAFNQVVLKQMKLDILNPDFIIFSLVVLTGTTLMAGSYPAFVLSSFEPASVLKGLTSRSLSGSRLRTTLVIFQFVTTVVLIASALVVYDQIKFLRTKDLGYNLENVITFPWYGKSTDEEIFKKEIIGKPGISAVSSAGFQIFKTNSSTNSLKWPGKSDESTQQFRELSVDFDFIELMRMKMLEGRTFSKEHNDTSAFILTRRAIEMMSLADPVGQTVSLWGREGKIVGVAEDFHCTSLQDPIEPVILMNHPGFMSLVYVRFDEGQATQAVQSAETLFKKINPAYPFNYSFASQEYAKVYGNEDTMGSLAIAFTFVAVVISAIGLFGLTAFAAEKRRKEISIRKTLGASVSYLVWKMSAEFIRLSVVALVLGSGLAYYFMSQFLSGYAYHTEIGWDIFLLTALVTVGGSVTIIVFQVQKAANVNPVTSLRSE